MAHASHYVVLHCGGLRSLVATALMLHDSDRQRLTLLHIIDGRDNVVSRGHHLREQAEAYGISRIVELDLPHLYGQSTDRTADGAPIGLMVGPQMVQAALAIARLHQAERVVWPVAVNSDSAALARAAEQVMLCEHLAQLEADPGDASGRSVGIDTPLLELTDQQVIELGAQLDVRWELAWSCLTNHDRPCGSCAGCKRRDAAFAEAGMVDPQSAVDQFAAAR